MVRKERMWGLGGLLPLAPFLRVELDDETLADGQAMDSHQWTGHLCHQEGSKSRRG